MLNDPFSVSFLCIWKYNSFYFIQNNMPGTFKWLITFSASHIILKWYPVLWVAPKFQYNIQIFMWTVRVSRLTAFYEYVFRERSLDFVICLYMPSFDIDVLSQCLMSSLNISTGSFNVASTIGSIKRHVIGGFVRKTEGVLTANISLATLCTNWKVCKRCWTENIHIDRGAPNIWKIEIKR